jgi:NADPH:quinone reductase
LLSLRTKFLIFNKENYPSKKTLPCVPGFEGCGLVVQSGGGILGWKLVGSKVAVTASEQLNQGCWGEYMLAESNFCLPLDDNTSFQEGACCFVNPLTVLGFLDLCETEGYRSIIHTAAASSLGKMLVRYFNSKNIPVINVIRREEQEELLKKEGAKFILNQNDPEFHAKLKKLCAELDCRCCFDAVAGELTGKILTAMPNSSTVYVYGVLSLKNCEINASDFIFRKKVVKGFWLRDFLEKKGLIGKAKLLYGLRSLIKNSLKTVIQKEFSLEDAQEAINYYKKHMSEGKVLIMPGLKRLEEKKENEIVDEKKEFKVEKKKENQVEEDNN